MAMEVTIYKPEEAEHARVEETKFQARHTYFKHADNCPVESSYACARCNANDPAVRKVRREKRTRVETFQRTGKILGWPGAVYPAGPAYDKHPRMTDEEASRVVLPTFLGTGQMRKCTRDEETVRIAERYLIAVGERHAGKAGQGQRFTCGCVVHADLEWTPPQRPPDFNLPAQPRGSWSAMNVEPCAKHRHAFEE